MSAAAAEVKTVSAEDLSLAIHEAGHATAALMLGGRVDALRMTSQIEGVRGVCLPCNLLLTSPRPAARPTGESRAGRNRSPPRRGTTGARAGRSRQTTASTSTPLGFR